MREPEGPTAPQAGLLVVVLIIAWLIRWCLKESQP